MLPSWANDSITRLRAAVITQRGSEIPDWSNPDSLVIPGCSVQPAGTSLTEDGRVQGTSDGCTCFLPPGSDVRAGDRILYNGATYTIMGEPRRWTSPTGLVSNVQLQLERWYG